MTPNYTGYEQLMFLERLVVLYAVWMVISQNAPLAYWKPATILTVLNMYMYIMYMYMYTQILYLVSEYL